MRLAEAASRVSPDDGNLLNTLGVAQYRVGQYADAIKTLTRSREPNANQLGGQPDPADIAFLALAHHQLGHADEARTLLGRLRQLLQQDRWKTDADAQSFLREAEALIEKKTP